MNDIKILTRTFDNIIEQETIFPEGIRNEIVKNVLDLQEQGIREALIKLGWTPPEENFKDNGEEHF